MIDVPLPDSGLHACGPAPPDAIDDDDGDVEVAVR
jgi:hypothetical protein